MSDQKRSADYVGHQQHLARRATARPGKKVSKPPRREKHTKREAE